MTMTITDEGKTRLLRKMAQLDTTGYKIAIGSGTTAPTASDTALESQITSKVPVYITVLDNVLYISAFFDTTVEGTINEIGILDASDDMLVAREVLSSPINKTTENTLTIDIQIEI